VHKVGGSTALQGLARISQDFGDVALNSVQAAAPRDHASGHTQLAADGPARSPVMG